VEVLQGRGAIAIITGELSHRLASGRLLSCAPAAAADDDDDDATTNSLN